MSRAMASCSLSACEEAETEATESRLAFDWLGERGVERLSEGTGVVLVEVDIFCLVGLPGVCLMVSVEDVGSLGRFRDRGLQEA